MRRTPLPQDDNRDDVDKHHDKYDGNDDDKHRGAVETNTGESDGADCYLEPFDKIEIRYVEVSMV